MQILIETSEVLDASSQAAVAGAIAQALCRADVAHEPIRFQEGARHERYGAVAWCPEDVQTLAPKVSLEEAETFLSRNSTRISDRMTEQGWEVLSTLLVCEGIDTSDPDEEEA